MNKRLFSSLLLSCLVFIAMEVVFSPLDISSPIRATCCFATGLTARYISHRNSLLLLSCLVFIAMEVVFSLSGISNSLRATCCFATGLTMGYIKYRNTSQLNEVER